MGDITFTDDEIAALVADSGGGSSSAGFGISFSDEEIEALKEPDENPGIFDADWWLTRPSGERISAKQAITGPLTSVGNALTFNLMDEIAAGGSALLQGDVPGYGDDSIYQQKKAELEGAEDSFREASPGIATGLDVAGAVRLPIGTKIGARETLRGKVGQAALEGAGYGAAYGFGEGDSLDERLYNAGSGATVGAFAGGALTGAGAGIAKGAGAIGKAASEAGRKLELRGFGAGKGAIKKANDREFDVFRSGQYENPITKAIAAFRKDGGDLVGQDPADLLLELNRQEQAYANKLGELLGEASSKQRDVIIPKFKYVDEYLESGLPGADIERAAKIADKLKEATVNNLDGTLTSLHKEKLLLGKRIKEAAWNPNADAIDTEIRKRVYGDLRRAVEDGYEAITGRSGALVKEANDQIAMRLKLNDIFTDALNTSEASDVSTRLLQTIRTTGGFGVPALIGAGAVDGPEGAIPGLVAGYYITTPAGRRKLADILRKESFQTLSKAAQRKGGLLELLAPKLGGLAASDEYASLPTSREQSGDLSDDQIQPFLAALARDLESVGAENSAKPAAQREQAPVEVPARHRGLGSQQYGPAARPQESPRYQSRDGSSQLKGPSYKSSKDIQREAEEIAMSTEITDELLDRLRKVESNDGDPRYLKSKAGAEGPYQLMPATGKRIHKILGIKEPYDPYNEEQARQIAKYHLEDGMQRFGRLDLALADYNAGHSRVKQALSKAKGEDTAAIVEAFRRIGIDETADYIGKFSEFV